MNQPMLRILEKEKLKSFEILKSAYDAEQNADSEENAASVISKCSETEYLNVLKDQALLKKLYAKRTSRSKT